MTTPHAMTGTWFINGDTACAEGAIAAGCRFFAGYPITPATEIAERMAERYAHLSRTAKSNHRINSNPEAQTKVFPRSKPVGRNTPIQAETPSRAQ